MDARTNKPRARAPDRDHRRPAVVCPRAPPPRLLSRPTLHPPGTRRSLVGARCIGGGGGRGRRGGGRSRVATGRPPNPPRGDVAAGAHLVPPAPRRGTAAADRVACGAAVRRHRAGASQRRQVWRDARPRGGGAAGRASTPVGSAACQRRLPKNRLPGRLTNPLLDGSCGTPLFPQSHAGASAHPSPRVATWAGHRGLPAVRPSPRRGARAPAQTSPLSPGAHADAAISEEPAPTCADDPTPRGCAAGHAGAAATRGVISPALGVGVARNVPARSATSPAVRQVPRLAAGRQGAPSATQVCAGRAASGDYLHRLDWHGAGIRGNRDVGAPHRGGVCGRAWDATPRRRPPPRASRVGRRSTPFARQSVPSARYGQSRRGGRGASAPRSAAGLPGVPSSMHLVV